MKVMTVLGTRPEIIRLSRVVEKLEHVGISTNIYMKQLSKNCRFLLAKTKVISQP